LSNVWFECRCHICGCATMAETVENTNGEEIVEKEDEILELAIHYVQNGS